MATTTATLHETELLDEPQTAAQLNMTPLALRVARCRGMDLPYVKIGRRVRYRVADVKAYLAAKTVLPQRDYPRKQ